MRGIALLVATTALGAASAWAAVSLPAGRTTQLVVRPSERVTIPAGPFRMGASVEQIKVAYALCTEEYRAVGAPIVEASLRCSTRFEAEAPQRTVLLPAFAIDRTEVTVGAYRACVNAGACDDRPGGASARREGDRRQADRWPVAGVTWNEAATYCRFRGGRLPTEAEWEKAARGTLGATWPWGDRWDGGRSNHGRRARASDDAGEGGPDASDGHEGAAPVGSYPGGASPYGVLNLAGNLWEWTDDAFARELPAGAAVPAAPVVSTADLATERVLRGGSFETPASDLRAPRRIPLPPAERHPTIGFRCAYQ